MHKLFKYDMAVTKSLIVFIVICTDNFWKADGAGAILQQSDHIPNLNERHTQHIGVMKKSNATIRQLNFVTATSYLNNLCVFPLFSIVIEDGQKVGRNLYLLN